MCEIGWDGVPGGFLHLQTHSSLVFIIYFNFFSLVDYCFLVKSQQSRIVSMGPILFYRSTQSRTMFFFMSMLRNVLLYYCIYWKWVNIHYNVVLKIPILKKLYVSSWKSSFLFISKYIQFYYYAFRNALNVAIDCQDIERNPNLNWLV